MLNYDPIETGRRVAATITGSTQKYPSYTTDLELEGLLYLYDATKDDNYLDHVMEVWRFRQQEGIDAMDPRILFTCLHFETYLRTAEDRFIESFVETADQFRKMLNRDQDGAVCYHVQPETMRIFTDMLQGYAVLMSRAGWLSGDAGFFEECANQYQIYRNILRNSETGLWHQGRNWGREKGTLSPGHWNRGQAWVMRGMVDSLDYLPDDSPYQKLMLDMLKEFVAELIRYQDSRGMWHQLMDQPEAWPETSGTAMLVHYLYKAFHRGWLPRDPYLAVAEKAIVGLFGFVREDGIVMNASIGTGPLTSKEGYLYRPSVPGDPHGSATVLMACAGPYLARKPKDMLSFQ